MKNKLVKKKLVIGREMTEEEVKLLDECKEIMDITGKEIAFNEVFDALGKEGYVIFYIIQACWGFLRSIFDLWVDAGYHASYILGRALTEYYIECCFLLRENTLARTEEYYAAWRKGTEPFKNDKKYNTIEKRAKAVGLQKLYEKSYRSLCNFLHVNLKGGLIARRTEKFTKDKLNFLRHMMELYLEILEIISKKPSITFSDSTTELLDKELKKLKGHLDDKACPNL